MCCLELSIDIELIFMVKLQMLKLRFVWQISVNTWYVKWPSQQWTYVKCEQMLFQSHGSHKKSGDVEIHESPLYIVCLEQTQQKHKHNSIPYINPQFSSEIGKRHTVLLRTSTSRHVNQTRWIGMKQWTISDRNGALVSIAPGNLRWLWAEYLCSSTHLPHAEQQMNFDGLIITFFPIWFGEV